MAGSRTRAARARAWTRAAPAPQPRPGRTADPAAPPPYVVVRGHLGPAQALVALAREAGIEVREEQGAEGVIGLPAGTSLRLADGRSAPGVRFDLALDYRTATRIALAPTAGVPEAALAEATGFFQALGKEVSVIGDVPGLVVARTVAMLVDLAVDAVTREVASAPDVDTAMRLGVNYPLGPLEWGERLSAPWVRDLLDALHAWYPTGRYAPCPGLRRRADAAEGVVSS